MSLEDKKSWAQIIYHYGILVLAVIGGLISYGEYTSSRNEEKISKSIKVWERFYNKQISDPWVNLNKFAIEEEKNIKDILISGTGTETEKYEYFSNYLISAIYAKKVESDVHIILDFFNDIIYCANKDICDSGALESLMGKKVRQFYNMFHPYFEKLRKDHRDDAIGIELEKFIRQHRIK